MEKNKSTLTFLDIIGVLYVSVLIILQACHIIIGNGSILGMIWRSGLCINYTVYCLLGMAFGEYGWQLFACYFAAYFITDFLLLLAYIMLWRKKQMWYSVPLIILFLDTCFTIIKCREFLGTLIWGFSIEFKILGGIVLFLLIKEGVSKSKRGKNNLI